MNQIFDCVKGSCSSLDLLQCSNFVTLHITMLTVDVDLADDEKVNEKFTEEDFDEELGSPTEVTSTNVL